MKEIAETLKEKIKKHEDKLKLHRSSKRVLLEEYEILKESNQEPDRQKNLESKLLSTIKNIEYHKATSKTYKKVARMIDKKL